MEEYLIQRVVKTIIQIVYDKSSFDGFPNAYKILKDSLFVIRRKIVLKNVNDGVVQ